MKKKTVPLILVLFLIGLMRGLAMSAPYGAGFTDTSDYLMGKVVVNVIFINGNGSVDQRTEQDWTSAQKADVVAGINQAMDWWGARDAAQNYKANLSFIYPTPVTLQTGYEPINRPHTDHNLWIGQVMTTLGYTETNYDEKIRHFNNNRRDVYDADWAFTIFMVNSDNDSDVDVSTGKGKFSDGWFAYARLGGPFMVMTYDNDGYGIADLNAVAAHEAGHIFYALDEYAGSGCTTAEKSGYLNIANPNCENGGTSHTCIMRGDVPPYTSGSICSYTQQMLGWRDSDSDGIYDILDTNPETILTAYSPDPTSDNTPTYTGTAEVAKYPNSNPYGGNNVTLNTISSVKYNIDNGIWYVAVPSDGSFDEPTESFSFTPSAVPTGSHSFKARTHDSAGNIDASPATDSLTITTGDNNPPTGSISINNGATTTNSLTITLNLSASDNMGTGAQMRFGVVNWCTAVPYATSYNFDLSSCGGNSDEGSKIVYVQFIDVDGKWSPMYSDSIEYKPSTPGNDSCATSTLPSGAQSTTIWIYDVPPYGDTFIIDGDDYKKNFYPSSKSGSWGNWAGVYEYNGYVKERSLLKANLDPIPPGSTIIDAKLKMRVKDVLVSGTPTVYAYKLTCDINLQTITWHEWTGLYSGCAPSPAAGSVSVTSADDVACFNLTSPVQSWVNNSSQNYGVMLKTNEPSAHEEVGFGSADEKSAYIKIQYYSNNTAPSLTFTGESGYSSDGVNPEAGSSATSFVFRVKYSDPDNNPPKSGYPVVHMLKNGAEISGSPYTMSEADSNSFTSGRKYTYTKTGLTSGSYTYFFEAYDKYDEQATGAPATPISAPSINEPPVLSWTGEPDYISSGVYPSSGSAITKFVYRVLYTDLDDDEPWSGYPQVHVKKGGVEIMGSPFTMTTADINAFSAGRIYTFLITGLQEGVDYSYYFEAKDANNTPAIPTISQQSPAVDNTPPIILTLTSSHQENVWNTVSNSPQFNWTASDASGVFGYSYALNNSQVFVPDITLEPAGNTISYINIADGTWYFHIWAQDVFGNWSDPATYGPIKIDVTAPTILSIIPSINPAKEGSISINITASEQMSALAATVAQNGKAPVSVSLSSQDNITWSGTYSVVSGYDGTATISVSGNDLAGKSGSGAATFTVDTIAPTKPVIASPTHPKNAPTSKNIPVFTWSASNDGGGAGVTGYSYALNQTEIFALDSTTETVSTTYSSQLLADGTYWLHLSAIDNAGNLGEMDSYKFVVDTTSPTLTASASPSLTKIGNVTITLTSNESLAVAPTVTVRQNGQGNSTTVAVNATGGMSWQGVYTAIGGFDGTASINVSGSDLASNTTTQTMTFQVDTTSPSASIALSPSSPLKTGPFTLNLTITDASGITGTPVLSYSPAGQQSVPVALSGSNKAWTGGGFIESIMSTGTATFSFSAVDAAGNAGTAVTSGNTFIINTAVNGNTGGVVENSDNTNIVVQPGTYNGGLVINIGTPNKTLPDIVEANSNTPKVAPIESQNLYRECNAYDSLTGSAVTTFASPITITMYYPDANNDGIVDGSNIGESRLRLYWLNENNKRWEEVTSAVPNFALKKFSASVTHFSIYSIMAVLPTAGVYPIPWKPGAGGKFDSANVSGCGSGIIFDNLPSEAKISIYNYSGDLIRELNVTSLDNGCKAWNGKNSSGRDVASGIYLAVIKTSSGEKVKKLAIER